MRLFAAVLLVFALGSWAFLNGARSETPPANQPQYDSEGALKLPSGYETWVFVGADLGVGYRDDLTASPRRANPRPEGQAPRERPPEFHNVFIEPTAYEHYRKTGEFPDKTMLAMTVYESREKDEAEIVSRGRFQGKKRAVELAVKDTARPDGSKTDWAYYAFPNGQTTAKAFPDRACYDCHKAHADIDNVWVQFYPLLRDRPKTE